MSRYQGFLAGLAAGFAGAYLLSNGISHHAAAKPVPVNIPYVPDDACGPGSQAGAVGKPALKLSVNGVPFTVELDSGAETAVLNPATATAIKLTSFPKAPPLTLSFTGQAQTMVQGNTVPLSIPGLAPIQVPFYTAPQIGCNLLPARLLLPIYNIDLQVSSVTFTHV